MYKFKFENLRVYQESLQLIDEIYETVQKFPREELYGLSDQLKRASVSIALNIAEGTSRTKKDFRHFLDLAKGSCYECVAIMTITFRRAFIDRTTYQKYYLKCDKLSRMISRLKLSLLTPERRTHNA